jgi:D-galactarolactone cycloisomerase
MKIRSVEARPVRLPRDFGAARGTAGTPTTLTEGSGSYRWSSVYPALYSVNFETALVKVTMESGIVGWGEAQAPLAPEVACEIVRLLLAPVLQDYPFEGTTEEIDALWQRMYSTMRVRGQTAGFMMDAISGVDIALWDIAGKMAGVPVYHLLGGSQDRVPAYVSGLPANHRAETARRYLDQGYSKFKLFYDVAEEGEFFRAMDELPPESRIAVDALWRLTPDSAMAFGEQLDARDALWFEAPLLPEDAEAHGQLASQLRTPIAVGESYRSTWEMRPFFRENAVGVYQPDLGRCGITEGLRLACMAQRHNVTVVPHLSIAMGPQIAAALHFAAAVENCELAEFNPQVLDMANRFLREPLAMEGAAYRIPERPGLGIDLDE